MSRVGCVVFSESITAETGAPPVELCELFLRLSPIVAVRKSAPYAVFLDFRGFDINHPDFQKTITLKVQALLKRRGTPHDPSTTPPFRIGFAQNAGFALLNALHPQKLHTPLSSTILEQLLDPFAVASATQKQARAQTSTWMKLLGRLGIHTLQDFTLLPPSALASRFGKPGLEFSRKLREMTGSADLEAWPLFVPPERLIESKDFASDHPLPALLEPMLFVSKELLDRLSARLRARLLRASRMKVIFEQEGSVPTEDGGRQKPRFELEITFCTPQGSAAGMLPSFRERVAHWLQKTETEDTQLYGRDLLSLTIEVLETAPGHRSQRDFFHQHEEHAEHWDSLLSRLSEKIGQNASFQAQPLERHLPEKGWAPCAPRFEDKSTAAPTHTPIAPDPQLEIFPARPTRILREPLVLDHHDGWLRWPDNEEHHGRRKRVLKWIGPERLCEGWWEEPSPEQESRRDYFRVLCAGGMQLWGYFELGESEATTFHLQGYFD